MSRLVKKFIINNLILEENQNNCFNLQKLIFKIGISKVLTYRLAPKNFKCKVWFNFFEKINFNKSLKICKISLNFEEKG